MTNAQLLQKIQFDCQNIEKEITRHKESEPMSKACDRIIAHIRESQEPFCNTFKSADKTTNPWHSSTGDEGCCIIS